MHSPQSVQHLGSNVKLIEDDSDQLKLLILMVHELSTTCAREQKVRRNDKNVEQTKMSNIKKSKIEMSKMA
ncbi:hypothetical protein DERF_012439 [Dermatophagoides farinae]|uniref:Uncharacterized protein n=1 Tax=Dermatophagoides farinae TaxID=6954 RepID=A0A922L3G0_DERFA|nr:hypothetical protein DERF_012439 [Dermatophagoides farinae]